MEDNFNIRKENITNGDKEFERQLRPLSFADFKGQEQIIDNLNVFVTAAKRRKESLDHVLLHGPPGLGKTTLATIISNELQVNLRVTSGPVLDKPGDLAGLLTNLQEGDVLFIDEIHRLSPVVEEYLYSAMEDFQIDIMLDKGPSARSVQLTLNNFTLIWGNNTLRIAHKPAESKIWHHFHLEYYDHDVLTGIVKRSAGILDVKIDDNAAVEIAKRSREHQE